MKLQTGDFVIYHKWKASTHPSPRAKKVDPARHGDTYSYMIEKFWKVIQVFDDETIEIETRRGKRHRINIHDKDYRKANILDRLFHRNRFF